MLADAYLEFTTAAASQITSHNPHTRPAPSIHSLLQLEAKIKICLSKSCSHVVPVLIEWFVCLAAFCGDAGMHVEPCMAVY